jgi:hypothetical protein
MIKNGFVACHRIVVDNLGSGGAAIVVHGGAGVHLDRSTVVNATASGIFLQPGARATLSRCNICNNGYCGLSVAPEAVCFLKDCTLRQNVCAHVAAFAGSAIALKCNDFSADADNAAPMLIQEPRAFVVARHNIGLGDSQQRK